MNKKHNKTSKVSVIIPVYNVEKSLRRCLDSVLEQSMKEIDIILVDDGSTDLSGTICDEYEKKDSRIRVFHQKNAGASVARNTGLEQVTSEYIAFVDSDDYIDIDYIEQLYMRKSDLTVCGIETCDENGEVISKVQYESTSMNGKDKINFLFLLKETDFFSPVCKLFRTEIIKKNKIQYPTAISWGEDGMFIVDYAQYISSIEITNYVGYHYIKYKKENTLSTQIREDIIEQIVCSRRYCLDKFNFVSETDYYEIEKFINKNIEENCAYFVRQLIGKKSIGFRKKTKLLKKFMMNGYVFNSINNNKLYPSVMKRCFRWKKAYLVILAYKLQMWKRKYNSFIKI